MGAPAGYVRNRFLSIKNHDHGSAHPKNFIATPPHPGLFSSFFGHLAAGKITGAACIAHQDDVILDTGFPQKALEGDLIYGRVVYLGNLYADHGGV
jgi:hypothetical protein